jgi:hypothetical protein
VALTLSTTFFILINLVVTPFYLLVIFAPRASLTRRVLGSLWPIALPALVHLVFIILILILLRPDVLGLWRSLYIENGMFSSSTVLFITKIYGFPEFAILHGWVHVLVGDMVLARWAYLDALDRATPSWLISLVALLICLVGPLGAIAYLALRPRYALLTHASPN